MKTVRFSSAMDERCTPLERDLEGKTLTVAQAADLVKTRGDEIQRSTFSGKVEF
ncbi:hypothetical protein [Hoeflea halophila]|uniref:hypothetical protein n=1 Tax=Hoeflea halophila TaxID=714899 RepID=UPI0015C7743B|nr:hypothetical protein [Hoeflea halophila]